MRSRCEKCVCECVWNPDSLVPSLPNKGTRLALSHWSGSKRGGCAVQIVSSVHPHFITSHTNTTLIVSERLAILKHVCLQPGVYKLRKLVEGYKRGKSGSENDQFTVNIGVCSRELLELFRCTPGMYLCYPYMAITAADGFSKCSSTWQS